MGADPPRPTRVVQAYLDDVEAELEAFDALFAVHSRFAAFHHASREPRPLPDGDPWRARMLEHEWLSKFATAYRYPTSSGRRDHGPTDDELRRSKQKLAEHLELARRELLG